MTDFTLSPPILAAILYNAPLSSFSAPPPDNYCTVPYSSCSLQWNCSFCLEIIIISTKLTLSDGRTGPLISYAQSATTHHNPGQSDLGFPARQSRPNRPRSFSDSWHCPNRSAWRHRRLHMMVLIAWTWVFWDIPDDREDPNDYLETRLSNASPCYCEHLRAMKVCSHKQWFKKKESECFLRLVQKNVVMMMA